MREPRSGSAGEVPPYVVACIDADPGLSIDGHHHVTAVETRDPDGGHTRWTLVQVILSIRDGAGFSVVDGEKAVGRLEPTVCTRCPMATLTIDPPEASDLVHACDQP